MNTFLERLFNLNGKVVAFTGGGGHICSELAAGFAEAGCAVAVLDLRVEKAQKVAKGLKRQGFDKVLAHAFDVSEKQGHIDALNTVLDCFGRVDVLINGAGINSATPILKITADEWRAVLDSQLTGTLFGCQVFGKQMIEDGVGSIINISSASADPPLSKAFPYSVAKAGIVNLTKNLGREWAQSGIRVNALRPGFFPTEWNREHFISSDREEDILRHTPMARFGEPNELVGAALWLASDASSFVTGAEITVDGGFSCMTI